MKLKITLSVVVVALLLCLQQSFLMSNSFTPPAGNTGASGSTCTGCHSTPGSGVGTLTYTITSHGNNHVVNSYFPNNLYDITVTITGTGQSTPVFGFAMKAQDGLGTVRGAFTILNSTTTSFPTAGEIGHKSANGTNSWTFQWTAPPANVGNINFYLAGNYADGDGSTSGDNILATSFVLAPAPPIPPVANFSIAPNDTICVNLPVTATDPHTGGPIKAYSMYFGALPTHAGYGTPPTTFTHTYTTPGNYLVTYVVSTDSPMSGQPGTIDTLTQTIHVIQYPDASFVPVLPQGCVGNVDTLVLLHPVGGVTYTPSYFASTPVGSAPNGGPYPLLLPNTFANPYAPFEMIASGFGCTSPVYKDSVSIGACSPPSAGWVVLDSFSNIVTTTQCKNTAYYIHDQSSGGSSLITSWNWNFNVTNNPAPPIPASATGPGPHKVIFPVNGLYQFGLTVKNQQGLSNTFTNFVSVNPCGPYLFIIQMSPLSGIQSCVGDSIPFSDNSYGATVQWHWNFGDGDTSNAPSVNHAYANIGTYTVSLAAKDQYGTWDTTYNTVIVGSAPSSSAGRDTIICKGQCVSIGAPAQNSAVYSWTSSPAGFTSTNAKPTVCPTITTTYYLSASNQAATCFAHDTVTVIVDNPPALSITASSYTICPNNTDTITFTPSNLANYSYSFNSGGVIGTPPSIGGPYVVSWGTISTKTITCTAYTNHGCSTTATPKSVVVQPCNPPVAKFKITTHNICTGDSIRFVDSSSGTPTNWYWYFGIGTNHISSSGSVPNGNGFEQFLTSGQHIVSLLVSNSGGTDIHYDTIMVYNRPSASFKDINPVCSGSNTILTYTGNASPSATYTWSFNPPNVQMSGSGVGPIYVSWPSAGNQHAYLIAFEHGCASNTADSIIKVIASPVVNFSYNILPHSAYVTYINNCTNASSYVWSFGDGSSSTVQNPPTHNYLHNGSFTVTLAATKGICTTTDTQVVVIDGVAGINDFTPSPYGLVVYHNDISKQLMLKWTEDKGFEKHIQLLNIKGELMEEKDANGQQNAMLFNTSNYASGIYLVSIYYTNGFVEVRKWIKN